METEPNEAPAPEAPASPSKHPPLARRILVPLVIVILALGLRLLFTWQVHTTKTPDLSRVEDLVDYVDDDFGFPVQKRNDGTDMEAYDYIARWILENGWYEKSADVSPLYPYVFLPAAYAATGSNILATRVIQAVVDSLTVLLIYLLTLALYDRRAACYAALLGAIYAPFIVYQRALLGEFLLGFLVTAFFTLLVWSRGRLGVKRAVLAGVLFGLAMVAKPTVAVFAPVVFVWVWRGFSWRVKPAVARTAVAVAAALVVILPFSYRNWRGSGHFHLIRGNSGKMLYMGNNAHATGAYGRPRGEEARALAQETAGMSLAEKDRVYTRAAVSFALENPRHFLRLLWRKFGLFFGAEERPNNLSITLFRQLTFLRHWVFAGFGFVFPLALAGFAFSVRRRGVLLVAAAAGIYAAAIILIVVVGRYRLGIVPLLLPAAGFALGEMVACVEARNLRRLLAVAVVAAAFALPINSPALGLFLSGKFHPDGFKSRDEGALVFHDDTSGYTPFGSFISEGARIRKNLIVDEIPPGARLAVVAVRMAVEREGRIVVALNEEPRILSMGEFARKWVRIEFPIELVKLGINTIDIEADDTLVAKIFADDRRHFRRSFYNPQDGIWLTDRLDRESYRRGPSLHMGGGEFKVQLELILDEADPTARLRPPPAPGHPPTP